MGIILNIDTAQENAFVCFSENGSPIATIEHSIQKDHASFLHQAIQSIAQQLNIELNEIDAVAVSNGPGSYTGLRVGLSSAKGICYALNKPLICIDSLQIMAKEFVDQTANETLICPLIDARRMEVFTAVYNNDLQCIVTANAMILGPDSFGDMLKTKKMIFTGSGADKFQKILSSPNADFRSNKNIPLAMSQLTHLYLMKKIFADLAHVEPNYVKAYKTF